MTEPTTNNPATDASSDNPRVDIRRNNLQFLEIDGIKTLPIKDITTYIDKKFPFGIALDLLESGYRVARPIANTGHIVITPSSVDDSLHYAQYSDRIHQGGNHYEWREADRHAKDWTLADIDSITDKAPVVEETTSEAIINAVQDQSSRPIPSYNNQPEILMDFAFQHLKDGEAKDMSMKFFQLAADIAYNEPESRMKSICLTALWNSKNAAVNGIVQRNIKKQDASNDK